MFDTTPDSSVNFNHYKVTAAATKQRVLNEQNANSDKAPSLTSSPSRPDDVSDESVCDLLATIEDAQWRAMSLYAAKSLAITTP
jgi:hypothetical protein